MLEHITPYLEHATDSVKLRISNVLDAKSVEDVAKKSFAFHFRDGTSTKFQDYYIATINNRKYFLESENFFAKFKKMYSLQGIDNAYLFRLEREKKNLLDKLDKNDLVSIYLDYFAHALIKHGTKSVKKNLASFFAKFIHTFRPNEYCALDNPIKNYFGLSNESFYLSFLIISTAYKSWINENTHIIAQVREQLKLNRVGNDYSNQMTDLKLLDLIFWLKANKIGH